MKNRIKRGYRISKYIIYKETLVNKTELFWTFIGSFIGMSIIALIQDYYLSPEVNIFLIGSFGASSVLLSAAIQSPLAQPRNLVGGHVLSAIIGVTLVKFLPDIYWLQASLAVSLSILVMQITKTLHPPGGASALIAVIGGPHIQKLGYSYVLFPILSGAVILLIVALIFNNITSSRSYPTNKNFTRIFYKRKL